MDLRLFLLLAGAVLVSSLKMQSKEATSSDCPVMWRGSCMTEVNYGDYLTARNGNHWGYDNQYQPSLGDYGAGLPALATTDIQTSYSNTVKLAQPMKVYQLTKWGLKCSDGCGDPGWELLAHTENPSTFLGPAFSYMDLYSRVYDAGDYTFDNNPAMYIFKPVTDAASGRGDPHMTTIHGEKFNIHRQGYAPLVSIASEGMPHLEVMALIQGVKKCQKKMFITRVNSSGSWLEKNVAVTVGGPAENQAFSVTVDGQEVWSPSSRGYQPPATDNLVFNHAGKFSINEISSQATPAQEPGIELKTAHDVKLKIVRPLRRPTAPPHLNFDIQGLQKLPSSFALGGLLGNDDHSQWSARDKECGANFERAESDEDGAASVASAA